MTQVAEVGLQGREFVNAGLPPVSRRHASAPSRYRKQYLVAKRIFDIVLATVLLPPIALVLAVCAAAIKLDSPGPVFFLQQRTGLGGRRFQMYKLRTMRQDAEALKEQYRHLSTNTWPDFKVKDDPRITRIGNFLRRTSLDELPQIFNVLIGDMTFVGPRPTSFAASTYQPWQTARLESKPGITGLWQVSGRSNIDFDERCRMDIAYCRNQSLWFDLKLLARTFTAVVSSEGAG